MPPGLMERLDAASRPRGLRTSETVRQVGRACRRRRADRGRRRATSAARGRGGPRRARPCHSARASTSGWPRIAVVRGRDDVAALRSPALDDACDRLRRRGRGRRRARRPRPRRRQASAARPQRRDAPGPRSQSGQPTTRTPGTDRGSSGCAPWTTTISSTAPRPAGRARRRSAAAAWEPRTSSPRPRRARPRRSRRRGRDAWSRPRSASGCRSGSAGSPSLPIRSTTVHAADDVADDGVVGREGRRGRRHHEELRAGGSRWLRRGLSHRDDALRVVGGRDRGPVDGRVARARRCRTASGRRPG